MDKERLKQILELSAKARELSTKHFAALEGLLQPARAAANQMKDAGMHKGSDPLFAALFEYDSIQDDMKKLVEANHELVMDTASVLLARAELANLITKPMPPE